MCPSTMLTNKSKRKALYHDVNDEIEVDNDYRTKKQRANNCRTKEILAPAGKKEEKCIISRDNLSNNSIDLNSFAASVCLIKMGENVQIHSYDSVGDDFFLEPTPEEIEMYDQDVLTAVRNEDLDTLRSFHRQGRTLKCSNKFGESLLHMACRKGMVDIVDFFVNQAGVPLSVRDDVGRSPLHDACWTPSPNFRIISLILQRCPDLLYICDRRGHTPLSYVRQDQWTEWKSFLLVNSDLITPKRNRISKRPKIISGKE